MLLHFSLPGPVMLNILLTEGIWSETIPQFPVIKLTFLNITLLFQHGIGASLNVMVNYSYAKLQYFTLLSVTVAF